ncbi:hypothetical protein [Uliginosibacterium sp. H1]|uniref:hypothetical protein n=1 Tax=Uliginosibacterium sp. H1 TaxID=3114757 RepID=UPI002E19E6C2|nr:hypothetical protein [Uliginosibacterium sp. H1]
MPKSLATIKFAIGTLIWWCAASYILRLRRNGITDADTTVRGGIDYKIALRDAGKGFCFIGVGAAKLTSEQPEFLSAVQRARQQGSLLKFILVDPDNSPAMENLQKFDGATHYKALVENSRNFIESAGGDAAEVRNYTVAADGDFEPYRLFLTDDACLVSPFIPSTGVDDQGRGLPQLRISSHGFPKGDSPTLYRAFKRYFDKKWEALGE